MALPAVKCRCFWRLRALRADAVAVCTPASSWSQAVRKACSSRSACGLIDRRPASAVYTLSGQSSLMRIRLPVTPLFPVSGLSMLVQIHPLSSSPSPLLSVFSSTQRKLSCNAGHRCGISKKTRSNAAHCRLMPRSDTNSCRLIASKTWTCGIMQTAEMLNWTGVALMPSRTQTCSVLQSARVSTGDDVRFQPGEGQFVCRQSRWLPEEKWGGWTTVPRLATGLLWNRLTSTMRQGRRYYAADAHKSVSALTVKRPLRKKTPKVPQEDMDHGDKVVAYAVAEELNLGQLREALVAQGLYALCPLPIDAQDALHVQAKYTVDGKKREIFFFRDGSAVFWSMPDVERKEALKFIRKHDIGRYASNLILREKEEMDLKYISGPTGVSGDTLQLNESQEEGQSTLEKYAFSNALAQSVKLAIWETSLETFVDSIEHVTEDLRDGQKIRMSRREVLRKTGELFALRHLINLSSDLLDTPDFYWDRAVLEPLYMAVYNHLDIARRTRVMNEKLSHCCELTELLSSHLNDAHHTRLEVMIIVLILVEVVFEIVHYIERYVGVPPPSDRPAASSSDPVTPASEVPSPGSP